MRKRSSLKKEPKNQKADKMIRKIIELLKKSKNEKIAFDEQVLRYYK